MILGLLPDDLDGVEFRAVGWQVQRHKFVQQQPFLAQVIVQIVVNAGVVGVHFRIRNLKHAKLLSACVKLPVLSTQV